MSHRSLLRTLAFGSAAALAACAEPITEPEYGGPSFANVENGAPSFGDALEARNHFVVFSSGIPEDFAAMVADAGGTVVASYGEVGVAVVSELGPRAARDLQKASKAQYVELEPMLELVEPSFVTEPMVGDAGIESADDPASAVWFARQWNMRAIEADRAWAAGRLGSSSTTVAILDTGIDYLHQDLVGRVDLSRSASYVSADDAYAAYYFPTRHPITDLHYHGTHVASTVATNGLVIAGVTSGVTLIGAKVCSVLGGCPGSAVTAGILHAIQNGADVANMSLGGTFSKSDYPGYVSVVQRLFNLANQYGVTMVVSAGNSAIDMDHDKDGFKTYCNAANVICVSATGPTAGGTFTNGPFENPDAFASYSNYGRSSVSVAAPGGNFTGVIGVCSSSSLVIPVCQAGGYYVGLGGTSMASPHASGVAALIKEDVGRNPAQIRARLMQSADDLGQPGTDPFYGKGRVNAGNAVGAN